MTKMIIRVTMTDDDEETSFPVPAKWEICDRCGGEGHHVNPAVDGHGISAEEWEQDWDDDSREAYFAGRYDVACEAGCEDGKVRVPDHAKASDEERAAIRDWERSQADQRRWDAEDRATRRRESGGHDY